MGDRPPQETQSLVVDQALANLRVPKAASKLMKFYAARSEGFRPSLKMIESETDIDPNNVSRVRQLLKHYGAIGYDGDNVFIDWVRLRAFALADPKKMGQKQSWKISPVLKPKPEIVKNDVHTYIGTLNSQDQRTYAIYAATAQALIDGVRFPELEEKEVPHIDPDALQELKNDVHTYIGNESSCGWYNPFDEPDPPWVYQIPLLDAYGEIVGFAHYNPVLPF